MNPDSGDEVDDAESAHATHHHKHDLDPMSDTEGRQCNVVLRGQEMEAAATTQYLQNGEYEEDSSLTYDSRNCL
eukprot:2661283-Karenia_brevis.AAC.1